MMNREDIEAMLHKRDFTDYRWINPKEMVIAQWVRVKCAFGCASYGSGACPPNTPTVEECAEFVKEYDKGLIIRIRQKADKDSYPNEWSREMTNKLLEIERELFLAGHPKVFLLNQTCCELCKDCVKSRRDCKIKMKARPSPESFAIDVFQTMSNLGMELRVVAGNPSEFSRIAFLLIE